MASAIGYSSVSVTSIRAVKPSGVNQRQMTRSAARQRQASGGR